MIQKSYSLHKIENPDKFTFKPSDYSRFKYGDGQIAEQFGVALAKGFIANHLEKEFRPLLVGWKNHQNQVLYDRG